MARQTTRSRKHDRPVSPLVLRKSPRQPVKPVKAVTRIISSPVARSAAIDARKSKTRQTVSASGLFKKQPKADRHSKKHRKRREETPEPTLLDYLQDGIEEAREAIGNRGKASFHDIHAGFTKTLASLAADDEEFIRGVDTASKTINDSLEDEIVQTGFTRGGKEIQEVSRIGDRVATFKKLIQKEEPKLRDLWKQWDEVQEEYRELGLYVFGREAFGDDTPGQDQGFFKEMRLLGLEHDTRVEELEEEIESIGTSTMKKMKGSEKEIETAAKKEQARFFQALL